MPAVWHFDVSATLRSEKMKRRKLNGPARLGAIEVRAQRSPVRRKRLPARRERLVNGVRRPECAKSSVNGGLARGDDVWADLVNERACL